MAEKKITKKDYFEMIIEAVADNDELVDFCKAQITALENKASKAKQRAAEKKAEPDELMNAVEAVLNDELQTRQQIFEQIEGEDITPAKVGARITKLVNAGVAVKDNMTVDGKKCMGYKLA